VYDSLDECSAFYYRGKVTSLGLGMATVGHQAIAARSFCIVDLYQLRYFTHPPNLGNFTDIWDLGPGAAV